MSEGVSDPFFMLLFEVHGLNVNFKEKHKKKGSLTLSDTGIKNIKKIIMLPLSEFLTRVIKIIFLIKSKLGSRITVNKHIPLFTVVREHVIPLSEISDKGYKNNFF